MSTEVTVTLRKACKCKKATASGPRVVSTRTGPVFTAFLSPYACDRCDTPWERVKKEPVGNSPESCP